MLDGELVQAERIIRVSSRVKGFIDASISRYWRNKKATNVYIMIALKIFKIDFSIHRLGLTISMNVYDGFREEGRGAVNTYDTSGYCPKELPIESKMDHCY